ncbi:hypothetical protein AB0J01_28300 [Streptomyces sp. NPDC050204]|uniref:hypothetical protein n=1 Tax=Streptomyces sp. NPDC050204 TaxID=3155514 RepID=UPI00342B049C
MATVTATPADDGWEVGVVAARAESVAVAVDGLALEAESDVGVDAGRHADVGVAEQLLDQDGAVVASRARQWTKIGPLVDVEETERHYRLRRAAVPRQVVLMTFEPDDGVNSPCPRGLAKPFTGDARTVYGRAS